MPLVSVIISSYNSSSFILETLESVAKQTWNDLELIITDDCSKDDTIAVCTKWLKGKEGRFVDALIISSGENTGISANANRGLYAAKGDWIKFLGADDSLTPDCIQENIAWIANHPDVKVLLSQIAIYKDTFNSENLIKTIPDIPLDTSDILALSRSADSQYKMLLLGDRINFSPSVFLHRETLLSVGSFDERFKMLEDYPLWLNLTKNGFKLHFMDKVTVNYRRHLKAINNTVIDYLINPNYFKSEDFRKSYTYPNLPVHIRLSQRYVWYVSQVFRCSWLNKNKKLNRFLSALLTAYLNPFKYFINIRKHLIKNLNNNEFYT